MRSGLLATIFLGAILGASLVSADPGAPTKKLAPSGDVVCGPRCLRQVLEIMKPESVPDLLEIVSKVQPEFERGSSLARLKSFLEEQGFSTLAIKPAPNSAILWPYPALLHLRGKDDNSGHYVLLLPQSDRATATVWSGLVGTATMPMWRLAEQVDGAVLISTRPIDQTSFTFPTTTDHDLRLLGWASIAIATPIIGFAWVSSRRRPHEGVVPNTADS